MRKLFKKSLAVIMVVVMTLTAAPLSGFVGMQLPEFSDVKNIAASVSDFFSGLSVKAEAAETYSGTCGDNLTWSLDTETGVLEISGTGEMMHYSTNSNKNAPWYPYRSYVTIVNIGDGVTTIGSYAFNGCEKLTSITIPENVISISSQAFRCCDNINTLNYNAVNCKVGKLVFSDIYFDEYGNHLGPVLTTINIGDKVEVLSDSAFYGCTSVETIKLPDSLKRIGKSAFERCEALTEINIPVNVTEIGDSAFYGCSKLATVNYDAIRATVTDRRSNFSTVFDGCEALTTVNVGTEVEAIPHNIYGGSLFDYIDTITTLNFNARYYELNAGTDGPFYGCDGLTNVTIGSEVRDVPCNIIYGTAFWNESSNWKNGVLFADGCLIYASDISGAYSVPDGTRLIAAFAFSSQRNMYLTNISFPESLVAIGSCAFDSCTNIKTFDTVPAKVEFIGDLAFAWCAKVEKYNVDKENANYSSDNYGVLFNKEKTKLIQYPIGNERTEYTIPEGVILVSDYAFSGTSFVEDEYKGWVYSDGGNLKKVNVSDSVLVIGIGAFERHDPLETVAFNSSSKLKEIQAEAFIECHMLKNIILPQSLDTIGDFAFAMCGNLPGYLHIPEGVETIGESILDTASNLVEEEFIQIGICSTSETSYIKTYAVENEYPFIVCNGEHEYSDHEHILNTIETPVTCTTDGKKYQECEICKKIIGAIVTIPATGHTPNSKYDTTKAATCTQSGTAVNKCVTCKEVLDTQEIPATGHTAGSWVTTKEPTCTAEGTKVKKCKKCGVEIETQAIAATEHVAGNWQIITMPTATDEGIKIKKCTGCGKEMSKETIPMVEMDVKVLAPSKNTVNFGDTLVLTLGETELPEGMAIAWFVEGAGVSTTVSEDGLECRVTSIANGNPTIYAKLVDEEENVITNADGEEIFDEITLVSKAGFWQKFISFFKNLFGINRVIY